jgi:23S rRNA-/tRNA-specific pseudouridylate synthase|eukprot:g6927.t1
MTETSRATVPRRLQPRPSLNLGVLEHVENELLVIDKPADVKLELKKGENSGTISVKQLVRSTPTLSGYKKLRWVHRLDMATSGVMVIGLSKQSTRLVQDLFDGREAQKCYVALLRGHLAPPKNCEFLQFPLPFPETFSKKRKRSSITNGKHAYLNRTFWVNGSVQEGATKNGQVAGHGSGPGHVSLYVDVNIAPDPKESFKMMPGREEDGAESGVRGRVARTKIVIKSYETFESQEVTRVHMYPETGRRHQLRVHAMHLKCPIVGDYTYDREFSVLHDFPRMMLHAKTLTLPVNKSRFYNVRTKGTGVKDVLVYETVDPF